MVISAAIVNERINKRAELIISFCRQVGGTVAMSSPDRHGGSSREIDVEPGDSHRRRLDIL